MRRFIPDIRKLLSARDIVPKVICLLLAVILWIYVNSTKVGEVKFTIPVEIKNLPENLSVLDGMNKNTIVTLTGRKDLLKSVNIKNITAAVNLETPEVGLTRKYPISVVKNAVPESVELSLSSNELVLTVERKIQKRVRIEPGINPPADKRYAVGNVRVDPPYTVISGPESQLKTIDSIRTNMITAGETAGHVEKEISIDRSRLPNIRVDIQKAKVGMHVFDASMFKKLEIMIDIKNPKEGYKYILSRQDVTVYLKAKNEDVKLEKDSALASVDAALIKYDYPYRDMNINIKLKNEDFEVAWIVPDIVTVKIIKE